MKSILIASLILFSVFASAQTMLVSPYIQNTGTTSVTISWETGSNTESIVEWGSSAILGNTTSGSTASGLNTSVVHEVPLSGLQPDTRYYYKVITGATESDTFSFRTLPSPASDPTIRLVAISDCQYDSNEPTKLSEVINNGIIAYFDSTLGSAPAEDHLNMCLLVGDNVNNGYDINQWRNEFFANIRNLGSSVCLLPVIGNHENNSPDYFAYFSLPQNGPAGYEEHTYYKDVSNTRIIGFDNYSIYANIFQLNWLSDVLTQTSADTSIDFVIFQEHYPYHSEMWLAGESDYARQVLDSLEQFTLQSGKPVVFLFGHTHGYSRGQMKDSKVLQINTATASGYIDTWGSTPQSDYPEFNKSFDEYGFTVIEITSGVNPQMLIKRISRGDAGNSADNILQDSILIRRVPANTDQPVCVFPVDYGVVHSECVNLRTEIYNPSSGDSTGAVEYQVAYDNAFSNLYFENWKHVENWYYDTDTQAGDSLNIQQLSNLPPGNCFYWRARYRTQNLDWSPWSDTEVFFTSASSAGNLIYNDGAEDSINGWTIETGILESLSAGECAGTTPYSGSYYFGIGGLCVESAYALAHQDIDVSMWSFDIDNGTSIASWGAWMSDYAGSDVPAIRLVFIDASMQKIDSTSWISTTNTQWTKYDQTDIIPANTRIIRFCMSGTRNSGTDNDSYIDGTYLYVVDGTINCNEYVVSVEEHEMSAVRVYPVPSDDIVNIEAGIKYSGGVLSVYSVSGKLLLQKNIVAVTETLDCRQFSAGLYFITLEKENLPVLYGKFISE